MTETWVRRGKSAHHVPKRRERLRIRGNKRSHIRIGRMRSRRRALVRRYRRMVGCVVCHTHDSEVLDLHHVRPESKHELTLQRMISQNVRMSTIRAEIRKCVVVCANDHRRIEHGGLDLGAYVDIRTYTGE